MAGLLRFVGCVTLMACMGGALSAQHAGAQPAPSDRFTLVDIFQLEWASDPRISPDGERVVYVRNSFDIMTDRRISDLWVIDVDGTGHRALTSSPGSEGSPRWSPGGDRLLYLSRGEENGNGSTKLWVRWIGTDDRALLATLPRSP